MGRASKPRAGSLQFWPRVRAKRMYPRLRSWKKLDSCKLLGFLGYKVGMTHVQVQETNPSLKGALLKNYPVTILECPSLKLFSIRFYKNTDYGEKVITEVLNSNLNKELKRKIKMPKNIKSKEPQEFDDIKVLVYTQPNLAISKKKPEILELGISGTKEEKLNYAKSLLNKEIKISEVFKNNQYVDAHAITKGKGFQGTVKRHHVDLRSHKSEKKRRGNIFGSQRPGKIRWGMPMPGQMGLNQRTEYNKLLLKISNDVKEINPKQGFHKYGFIDNEYVLIKGSLPGSKKRLIVITEPIRNKKVLQTEIKFISK